MSKLKKLSRAQIQKNWLATQACYCKALLETYPNELNGVKESSFNKMGTDREMRSYLKDLDLPSRSEDIHRRYMRHILNLSTKELETIIRADNEGAIKRAPYTIDEITFELLNRAVNPGESHESKEASTSVRNPQPAVCSPASPDPGIRSRKLPNRSGAGNKPARS